MAIRGEGRTAINGLDNRTGRADKRRHDVLARRRHTTTHEVRQGRGLAHLRCLQAAGVRDKALPRGLEIEPFLALLFLSCL